MGLYRGIRTPLRGGQALSPSRGWASRRKEEKSEWKFSLRLFPRGGGSERGSRARQEARPETRREVERPKQAGPVKTYAFYRPGMTPREDLPRKGMFASPLSRGSEVSRRGGPDQGGLGRRAGWVLKAAGLAALLGCVVWSRERTTALLQDMAGLRLNKVSLEGAKYLEEAEILRAASLPMGESMFKLDLKRTAETLQGLPWMEKVFIERRLPSSVLISVRERKPVALVERGQIFGVDAQGRLLPPCAALAGEDLPLISGLAFPPEAMGTTAAAQSLRPVLDFLDFLAVEDGDLAQNVSEVNLAEAGALRVTFIDGLEAIFEPAVTQAEFKRMALVLGDLNLKGKRAGTMDFRYKDMVLVKLRN